MIKKVKVKQLKPGHFVHDFNSGLLDHPFLRNRIKLRSHKDIEKIIKHRIHEVHIDTSRGGDVDDAPMREEVRKEIQTKWDTLQRPIVQGDSRGSKKID